MKKSTFWLIVAAVFLLFSIHSVYNMEVLNTMFGCAGICASLVVGAWYEREEKEQKENH